MTISMFINELKAMRAELLKPEVFRDAALTTHNEMVARIFADGIASNGNPIGQYNDTNQLYVNPKYAPRKTEPIGKTGKKVFASGKKKGEKHKTTWFKSYKAFRKKMGRQVNHVDLRLTGDLQRDFASTLAKVDGVYQSGVKRELSAEKIDGMEKKYGKIFEPTEAEEVGYGDKVTAIVAIILGAQ